MHQGYAVHATLQQVLACSCSAAVESLCWQLLEKATSDSEVSDVIKSKVALKMADVEKKLIDGASDKLQLLDVASYISCTVNGTPTPWVA